PIENLMSEWLVIGPCEERCEVRGVRFVETTLKLLLLAPIVESLLQLAILSGVLLRFLVNRDRIAQTARPVMQFAEPDCRRQVARIESKGGLEAALRHVVLPEHEGCDARTKPQASVARTNRRGFVERVERVSETSLLDGCGSLSGQQVRVTRHARLGGVR